MTPSTHFKGWAKPGPVPPGALGAGPVPEPGETLDAISGHYRIFQRSGGHRFSTDDVLVAWYGTSWCPTASRILELGSGIGTAGMIAAWRLPAARLVTVEAQEASVRLARKSADWNGLSGRMDIRLGDLRDPALIGPEERFDLALGSPPYFPPGTGVASEDPQRLACRFELRGSVADYFAVAARHLAPGGLFACVFPIRPGAQADRVRDAAAAAGLVVVRMRPVTLQEGEPPLLGLFAMTAGADLPAAMRGRTWIEPELVIRRADGSVHPEYSAVKLAFGFPP